MQKLPTELIIDIFARVINDSDENYQRLYYADFFGLRLVCKRWRNILQNNAMFIYREPSMYTNKIHKNNRKQICQILHGKVLWYPDDSLECYKARNYRESLRNVINNMRNFILAIKDCR